MYTKNVEEPVLALALAVIQQAQRDLHAGCGHSCPQRRNYYSALEFFEGEGYQFYLAVIESFVPEFRPHESLYPRGVANKLPVPVGE